MKRTLRILLSCSAMLLVGGCTTMSLEELRHTTPKGTPFQNALSQRYLDFAISEAEEYDWVDSMYFADKGLALAYGKDMPPEDLSVWNIPQHALADMQQAHGALLVALTEQVVEKRPELAADAQFFFDCWVEQQEEDWQEDDIAHCRDGFEDALKQLGGVSKEKVKKEPVAKKPAAAKEAKPAKKAVKPEAKLEKAPEPKPEPKPEPESTFKAEDLSPSFAAMAAEPVAPAEPAPAPVPEAAAPMAVPAAPPAPAAVTMAKEQDVMAYVVFFEEGQPSLSVSGKKVVGQVIQMLKGQEKYEVVLHGHNDTAESAKGDFDLSQKRAEAVKAQLIAGGIKEDAIKIYAFGSSDPHVKTPEGVKEPANRRVEIFLN